MEGAYSEKCGGGLFLLSSLAVAEERHERVNCTRVGSDGGLVNVEDGEAGEESGGDGARVAGGGGEKDGDEAGEETVGDEADFGVVIEGECKKKREGTVAEGRVVDER